MDKEVRLNRTLAAGLMLLMLFAASGATCRHHRSQVDPSVPAAFVSQPTLPDIIYAVNANTDRIQQIHTDSASLRVPGVPAALRATLDLERPQRFRLRAKLISSELDVGSNEELFWFWAKSAPEPAVYYATHREYAISPTRSVLPLDPDWLVEAMGLVSLEPGGMHEGPYPRESGQVEVRTQLPGVAGTRTRVLVIDDRYGWVLEQHLYDSRGQLLATARNSNHGFYPDVAAALPHRIEIEMPAAELSLRLDVTEYQVNQSSADSNLWSMPQLDGYRPVNVAHRHLAAPLQAPSHGEQYSTPLYRQSRADLLPGYRGHGPLR